MENFIISLFTGETYHLKSDYKKITVHNKMAILYYVEQFSQVPRGYIKSIEKTTDETKIRDCSLIITVTKKMVKRFNKA